MSLADRLTQVKQSSADPARPVPDGAAGPVRSRRGRDDDPFAEVKHTVHEELLANLGPRLYDANLDQGDLELQVRQMLQSVLDSSDSALSPADRTRVAQEVADDILGHGPLEPFLRDPEITEIMVNGFDQIFVERYGRLFEVDARFQDEAHLRRTIDKIVARIGRRVDEASPMVDARLSDGSRVNAIIPPVALDGCVLTIRKFATDPFTVSDLITFGTMSAQAAEFLAACVRGR